MRFDEARAWAAVTKMPWGRYEGQLIQEVNGWYLDQAKKDSAADFRHQLQRYLRSDYFSRNHDRGDVHA